VTNQKDVGWLYLIRKSRKLLYLPHCEMYKFTCLCKCSFDISIWLDDGSFRSDCIDEYFTRQNPCPHIVYEWNWVDISVSVH